MFECWFFFATLLFCHAVSSPKKPKSSISPATTRTTPCRGSFSAPPADNPAIGPIWWCRRTGNCTASAPCIITAMRPTRRRSRGCTNTISMFLPPGPKTAFSWCLTASMTDTGARLNGQSVGPVHQGGYYRFKYEVTRLLKFGATNRLEVTVDKHSAKCFGEPGRADGRLLDVRRHLPAGVSGGRAAAISSNAWRLTPGLTAVSPWTFSSTE